MCATGLNNDEAEQLISLCNKIKANLISEKVKLASWKASSLDVQLPYVFDCLIENLIEALEFADGHDMYLGIN